MSKRIDKTGQPKKLPKVLPNEILIDFFHQISLNGREIFKEAATLMTRFLKIIQKKLTKKVSKKL